MVEWIALSDRKEPLRSKSDDALLHKGALILEFSAPMQGAQVLLDYRSNQGWTQALSIFHDPETGIGILHRQGQTLARHNLPGPLPQEPGIARLTLRWDAPLRQWWLRYERPGSRAIVSSTGSNPMPLPMADLMALCNNDTAQMYRHPAVLWFGATDGGTLPEHAPWIGLRTPIATPTGFRHAAALLPGDLVLTRDHGIRKLMSVRKMCMPSRGYFAPVLLRAPYFGARQDLLVSANQQILLGGPAVEYLLGEDEVLAEARHLTDGNSALFDTRRPVTNCVSLDMGYPALIESDGCTLASGSHDLKTEPARTPRRVLRSYEAVPLLLHLGGKGSNGAA